MVYSYCPDFSRMTMIGIIIFMDLPNSRKPNDKVQASPNGQRCTRTLAQNTPRRLIGKWWATKTRCPS